MAAGNGAGFAPPASAPVRGGGRGARRFGGTRREGGVKGFGFFFFKVPPEAKALPAGYHPASLAGGQREGGRRLGGSALTPKQHPGMRGTRPGAARSPPAGSPPPCQPGTWIFLKNRVNRGRNMTRPSPYKGDKVGNPRAASAPAVTRHTCVTAASRPPGTPRWHLLPPLSRSRSHPHSRRGARGGEAKRAKRVFRLDSSAPRKSI